MFLAVYLQQGNFNSSVGPDGYMLSALTCGMSPVTSITEALQQVWYYHIDIGCALLSCGRSYSNFLYRLSPWDYFGPLPFSTWGVLTALCVAAWYRGSNQRQLTRGSNTSLTSHSHTNALRLHNLTFKPLSPAVHNHRWGGGQVQVKCISEINLQMGWEKKWKMFTCFLSSDVTPYSHLVLTEHSSDFVLMCPPASFCGSSLTFKGMRAS